MMNEKNVNKNMEINKPSEELTEALCNWYKTKVNSRLDKKRSIYLVGNPTYELYTMCKECPERMWYEKPSTECNCD